MLLPLLQGNIFSFFGFDHTPVTSILVYARRLSVFWFTPVLLISFGIKRRASPGQCFEKLPTVFLFGSSLSSPVLLNRVYTVVCSIP